MARRAGEVYASEHELFDIGLASVELHAMGRSAVLFDSDVRGEADGARSGAPGAATDHANLLSLSVFLHAGEIGIALALAGLFELFDAARPIPGAMLTASGCALAWYGWHRARAVIVRAGHMPARVG
jgi:hypothetical protein